MMFADIKYIHCLLTVRASGRFRVIHFTLCAGKLLLTFMALVSGCLMLRVSFVNNGTGDEVSFTVTISLSGDISHAMLLFTIH